MARLDLVLPDSETDIDRLIEDEAEPQSLLAEMPLAMAAEGAIEAPLYVAPLIVLPDGPQVQTFSAGTSYFVVAQESAVSGADTLTLADGNDTVLGDADTWHVDTSAANNTLLAAVNLDDSADWRVADNPLVDDPTVAHTAVAAVGRGAVDFFSVTVGAGETLSADIDFGYTGSGAGAFDSLLRVFDQAGLQVALNDDAAGPVPDLGSESRLDAQVAWTNQSASAQTIYIAVEDAASGQIAEGATYLLNLSVSGHAATSTSVEAHDSIHGGAGDDQIFGFGGADSLVGGTGADLISGGAGNDTLLGEDGDDTLLGGDGDDSLVGGAGFDVVSYADAASAITGSFLANGAAVLGGGAGADTLSGFEALVASRFDDVVVVNLSNVANARASGGQGDDRITVMGSAASGHTTFGDDGNDTILASANQFMGNVNGGAGFDTFDLSAISVFGWSVDLGTGEHDIIAVNFGDLATITGIEGVVGTQANDSLVGDNAGNLLSGANGDDTLLGEGGADTLIGGLGDDSLDGGLGVDRVSYASTSSGINASFTAIDSFGFSTVSGSDGIDTLIAVEVLEGTAFADTIVASLHSADASVLSGAGDDFLVVSGLAAQGHGIEGGLGDDTIRSVNGQALGNVDGGDGQDLLDLSAQSLSGWFVDFGTGTQQAVSLPTADVGTITGIERVIGTQLSDGLLGGTTSILLDGHAGDDVIVAGTGDDTLIGGTGNDVFLSASGHNLISGGTGTDGVSYGNALGPLVITYAATGDATVTGMQLSDTLTSVEVIEGSGHNDTIAAELRASWQAVSGGAGADRITVTGSGALGHAISGGDGNDTILGTDGGFLGNIDGGLGIDVLVLGASSANGWSVDLASRTHSTTTSAGSDSGTIAGVERIFGGQAGDTLVGDDEDNLLNGQGGADLLSAGLGDDSLYGGDGSDLLFENGVNGGNGIDVLNGGAGVDTLLALADHADDTLFDLRSARVFAGSTATDSLFSIEALFLGGGADALGNAANNWIEGTALEALNSNVFRGGLGSDTLIGGAGDDSLDGQGGNDLVEGGEGNDTLLGGTGRDTLLGGAGNDLLVGRSGAETLDGGAGQDVLSYAGDQLGVRVDLSTGTASGGFATLDTISNLEHLIGGVGDDLLQGDNWANDIFGSAGDDHLVGRDGNDTLDGGGGHDQVAGGAGADILSGSTGNDTLDYSDDQAGVSVSLFNNVVSGGHATGDVVSGFENVLGGAGADQLVGTLGDNAMTGGMGNDTLNGLGGTDTLLGGGGNDRILANSGAEILDGGTGYDVLSYASDVLGVRVSLGSGVVSGGNAAGDVISGFEGVIGGRGRDGLVGDGGANILSGGASQDTLTGWGGDDTLVGGAGDDVLSGGLGADAFLFMGGFGRDMISDFGAGDVARVLGTGASFGTFDINGDGQVNAADAALTSNVAVGGDGALVLRFNASGTLQVEFAGITSLDAGDLAFV